MPRDLLHGEGMEIGRERAGRMMRRMDIAAIYRRPNTSKPSSGHKVYPYLLRGLTVDRPNQVWAMDITYIPMARGLVYLASLSEPAKCFAAAIQSHWHVENTLHYTRDVTSQEDQSRIRHNPGVFARLRGFGYNILRRNRARTFSQGRYAAALSGLDALQYS